MELMPLDFPARLSYWHFDQQVLTSVLGRQIFQWTQGSMGGPLDQRFQRYQTLKHWCDKDFNVENEGLLYCSGTNVACHNSCYTLCDFLFYLKGTLQLQNGRFWISPHATLNSFLLLPRIIWKKRRNVLMKWRKSIVLLTLTLYYFKYLKLS